MQRTLATLSLFALTITLTLLTASPSAEACKMSHVPLFDQLDEATHVARGRVVPGGVAVKVRYKGAEGKTLKIKDAKSSCSSRLKPGERVFVVLGADHRPVAHYQSVIRARPRKAPHASPELLDETIKAWIAATTDAARVDVLVGLIAAHPETTLGRDAATRILDTPKLLDQVSDTHRRKLRAALERPGDNATTARVAGVLARLGDLEALPLLLAHAEHDYRPQPYFDALETLTNHDEPPYTRSYRFEGDADAVAASWAAWIEANAGQTVDAMRRSGYRERGLTPPDPKDRAELARFIAKGPDLLTRIQAVEACERLRGEQIAPYTRYTGNIAKDYWKTLAERCEAP